MNYQYPPAGAYYNTDKSCTFTLWAPLLTDVSLVLDKQAIPMEQDERGYWSVNIPFVEEGTRYWFSLNGKKTLPDPASRCQPDGVHGASAVAGNSFNWSDDEWKGMALEDMIQYELHTGTFTKQGNFDGIIDRLNYLELLGINAIELLPVNHFPGNRNWGYDGVFPFAVHTTYGGIEGLKRLVNEAHQRGIAVILDVVYNHLGPEGNHFADYGPYFTQKYHTPWAAAINFDDAHSDGVRHFFWQNALLWLDEFHIDGLRLDAVHAIWDSGAVHFLKELKNKVAALEKQTGRKKLLIIEFDLNKPEYILPLTKGGYGMDGQWADEFHHALHTVMTGERDGYYEDFGDMALLAKAYKDSYVYTGEYSMHRNKYFGAPTEGIPYHQFIVFSQNHDQTGNRLLGDRLTTQLSFEALKLAAASVLLAPQTPLLFMGEEYGEKNPFQFFVDHEDPALVEGVRKGRRKEFAYFNWQGEFPDPAAEETFRKCILSWNQETDPAAATLLSFYRYLIAFRKTRPAMQARERKDVQVMHPENTRLIVLERSNGDDNLLILFNYDEWPADFSAKTSGRKKIFDSAARIWGGPGTTAPDILHNGQLITVPAQSVTIFE